MNLSSQTASTSVLLIWLTVDAWKARLVASGNWWSEVGVAAVVAAVELSCGEAVGSKVWAMKQVGSTCCD